jgi:hypothetical protein
MTPAVCLQAASGAEVRTLLRYPSEEGRFTRRLVTFICGGYAFAPFRVAMLPDPGLQRCLIDADGGTDLRNFELLYSALAQTAGGGPKAAVDQDQILTEILVDRALMKVWHVVQDKLSNFTYPTINHELPSTSALPYFHKGEPLAPHRLGASWGFRNLIGAMYVQFYWLITSRADIKRCKYCGRIISLAPSTFPDGRKGRKPRSDKEYCNKWCQQSYDYHKRRKHKRARQSS